MLILVNKFFGEQIVAFFMSMLEKLAVSFWQLAGVTLILILGISFAVAAATSATIHFGGLASFVATTVIQIFIWIIAAKWILLIIVCGVPATIIVFGIHRAMRSRGVSPTIRGLFLWAALLAII